MCIRTVVVLKNYSLSSSALYYSWKMFSAEYIRTSRGNWNCFECWEIKFPLLGNGKFYKCNYYVIKNAHSTYCHGKVSRCSRDRLCSGWKVFLCYEATTVIKTLQLFCEIKDTYYSAGVRLPLLVFVPTADFPPMAPVVAIMRWKV